MQEFMEGKVFGGVKTSSPIAKIVTFRPLKRWPREALVDGVGWVGGDGDVMVEMGMVKDTTRTDTTRTLLRCMCCRYHHKQVEMVGLVEMSTDASRQMGCLVDPIGLASKPLRAWRNPCGGWMCLVR